MHYKLLSSILGLLLLSESISGQPFSEKRTFQRSVPVNNEMTLELNNKYGSIHISPASSDSVTIRAEIEASSSNIDRIEKMLQGININFSETSYLIKAETEFTQTINMLFESFKGMTKKIIPYESKIQINYFVAVPEFLDIRIINKYGDVYLENSTGDFTIDLSNGSFKANILNKSAHMNLNFCDASINKIAEGYIDASFSEVVIGESKDLSITSVSSRFDLKKTVILDTKSRRDKFFIGTTGILRGNSYFTDFRIDELGKEINLVSKYGTINAENINKSIELININSAYTDIYLTFDPSISYNLDIKHSNAFLVTPDYNANLEKKTLNEEKKEYMTFGTVGKNPGNIKVNIDATKGNINLK
jgi:hypothetical protein